ncbi:MAG: hypothetical protein KAJ55_13150 [Anaerolineales bacterium]|nr:hypothetical protein [Anaerolineales bacterium]
MTLKRDTVNEDYVFGAKSSIPLQVTRWTGQRVGVTTSAVAELIQLPAGTELIEVTATENVYVAFGDGTVVATQSVGNDASRLFLAGVQILPVPINPLGNVPFTHMSVIEESSPGVFQAEKVD